MNTLDESHKSADDQRGFQWFPTVVKPEIGSPHSVSDPRDIQISDADVSQLGTMLPDEHDLPGMDPGGLQELLSPEPIPTVQEGVMDKQEQQTSSPSKVMDQPSLEEIERPALFQDAAQELHDIHPQDTTLQEGNLIPTIGALEETPLSKPASDMPAPPRKPRPGKTIKTKPRTDTGIDGQKDDNVEDIPQVEERHIRDSVVNTQQPVMEEEAQSRDHIAHDREQRNPPALQLSPVIPDQSPLRKRRPHKLIIDTSLKFSNIEMKEHKLNTEDIISPMIPNVTQERRVWFKEPAEEVLRQNKDLGKLFTRNCKFGLRTDENGSEGDITLLPGLLGPEAINKRKRIRRSGDEGSLPPKFPRPSEELPSVELGRDASSRFSHLSEIERNLSHSIIAQSGDESIPSIRLHPRSLIDRETSGELNSVALQDISTGSAQLPMWLEEPELNLSTMSAMKSFHEEIPQDLADNGGIPAPCPDVQQSIPEIFMNGLSEINGQNLDLETIGEGILILVKHHLRTSEDLTTFRTICPPSQYSRNAAASFFHELCYRVSKQQAFVRQDEPYGEIYIWLSDENELPRERVD